MYSICPVCSMCHKRIVALTLSRKTLTGRTQIVDVLKMLPQDLLRKVLLVSSNWQFTLRLEAVSQPLTNGPQAFPPDSLVGLLHKFHNAPLETQLLKLLPLFWHFLDETCYIITTNRKYLLIILPALGQNLSKLARKFSLVLFKYAAGVFAPEGRVAMGR